MMLSLALLLAGAAPPLAHLHSAIGKPRVAHPRWMTALDGKRSLADLSIPGTHDTCALHGGPLAECQRWTLADQLGAGVRFLDIRCRHIEDRFDIHHGPAYQKQRFDEVRDQCEAFLAVNPGECVLMSVKEEWMPSKNKKSFADVFKGYIAGRKQWHLGETIPKLGDVRGKIVLLAREKGIGGIPWAALDIQDDYDVKDRAGIPAKWGKVKAHLAKAAKGGKPSINFASGTGLWFAWPASVAESVNKSLLDHLPKHEGRTGVLVMDYPGEALIERILEKNK